MKKLAAFASVLIITLIFYACSANKSLSDNSNPVNTSPDTVSPNPSDTAIPQPSESPGSAPKSSQTPSVLNTPSPEDTTCKPASGSEIEAALESAFKARKPSVLFDMSAMGLPFDKVELTITNSYFNVLARNPELKYAYSVTSQIDAGTGIAVCQIYYMPYKTGGVDPKNLPAGTYAIATYQDLITVTNKITGSKSIPVAITNPNLDFDTMQMVLLSQCGYGYISYTFNDNATKLTANAAIGLTLEQCAQKIQIINDDAEQILSGIIKNGMSDDDKVKAVYDYVTSTVVYDPNFKNSPSSVSIDSQTAFGPFENKTAICGGYSNAVYVLMSHLVIPCFNVTGKGNGVDHMWNVILYNGGFCYFDATWDAENRDYYGYFAKTRSHFQTFGHSWDTKLTDALIK